jgi:hypothetical protein
MLRIRRPPRPVRTGDGGSSVAGSSALPSILVASFKVEKSRHQLAHLARELYQLCYALTENKHLFLVWHDLCNVGGTDPIMGPLTLKGILK